MSWNLKLNFYDHNRAATTATATTATATTATATTATATTSTGNNNLTNKFITKLLGHERSFFCTSLYDLFQKNL